MIHSRNMKRQFACKRSCLFQCKQYILYSHGERPNCHIFMVGGFMSCWVCGFMSCWVCGYIYIYIRYNILWLKYYLISRNSLKLGFFWFISANNPLTVKFITYKRDEAIWVYFSWFTIRNKSATACMLNEHLPICSPFFLLLDELNWLQAHWETDHCNIRIGRRAE